MATTSIQNRPQLAPTLRSLLGSLRGWIRLYVWVEGLAAGVAWLGAAFWGSLAIDWFFEPPVVVRAVMLAVAGLVLAGVLVQLIGRRAFLRLSNASMATLLERRFPHLDDSLLTAVTLTGRKPDPSQCNPQMLARTCREAEQRTGTVALRAVFNPRPLLKNVTAAVLLAGTVVAFVWLFPGASRVWAQRMLTFSDALWPRRTRLEVEGFENGVRKVARGADLEVIAKADTLWPVIPQVVEVRYQIKGGARGRKAMDRRGIARVGKDPFQEYSYTFEGVLAPIRFDVVGGDDRVRDLRIEVVESPAAEMVLRCRYPAYMERKPRSLPATGMMQIPFGTEITVRATADKELVSVQIDSTRGERPLPPHVLALDPAADPRTFLYTIESLTEDTTLLFTLFDADGIRSREPVRLGLVTIADGPPQLAAQLQGIGPAITPEARLPVAGRVSDDYGIDEVWFAYTVDQLQPEARPVASPPNRPTDFELAPAALEVRDLKLSPGQKLLVCVKASDRYDLGDDPQKPNVGSSERWLLDVVTGEQLRAMLDARELVLRQRFEVIVQEVTETRDLLLRVEFDAPDADGDGSGPGAEESEEKQDAGAEPGDEAVEALSPERRLDRRTLAVQRALQNSRKNAHETDGVAEAFDDIRLQLVNNRIDTEELKIRLEQGIAVPLHRIADEMFPELERRLERLRARVADRQLGPQRRDLARQQAEAILAAMREVLERMIELEDFNEAVELLRTIIKLQEQLHEQTDQRHKQRIRELLED